MRIRSIKPEFWRSLDTARYDYFTRLLFIGLWSYVDDNGVGNDSVDLIRADLFPLDAADSELSRSIHGGLTELSNGGQIVRYEGPDRRRYLYVRKWEEHQRINRPSRSTKPLPTSNDTDTHDTLTEPSVSPHDNLTEGSSPEQGNKGTREQGTKGSREVAVRDPARKRATRIPDGYMPSPDLIETMRAECPKVDLEAEHRKFVDYWRAKSGKDATKLDWDATWRNWVRRAKESNVAQFPARRSASEKAQAWLDTADEAARLMGGGQ